MSYFFALMLSLPGFAYEVHLSSVELELERQRGATKYEIELENKDKKIDHFESPTEAFKFQVPFGKYKLRGRAFDTRGVPGAWSKAEVIEVAAHEHLAAPKLVNFDPTNPKLIHWERVQKVPVDLKLEYQKLLSPDPKAWMSIKIVEDLDADQFQLEPRLPAGRYRLFLTSKAEGWLASSPTIQEFLIKPKAADFDQ